MDIKYFGHTNGNLEMETNMNPTKLQLNLTYPALVALIGENTEAQINIRQQIVDRFAKEFLKPLASSDAMKLAAQSLVPEY